MYVAEGDQLNVKSLGATELQRGGHPSDRQAADCMAGGLTGIYRRCEVPPGDGGERPSFKKVTDADLLCVLVVKTHRD